MNPDKLPPSANTPKATPPKTLRLPVGSMLRIHGVMMKVTSGRDGFLILAGDTGLLGFDQTAMSSKINIFGAMCSIAHCGRKILKLRCAPGHRFDTRYLPPN